MNMGIMLELRILTIVGILENLKKENGVSSVQLSLKTAELELVVGKTVNNLSCRFIYLESVKVKAHTTHSETGLAKVTLLKPFRTTIHYWGKCASYELSKQREQLTKVEIRTPLDVAVFFHSKDQVIMPKELRARIYLGGFDSIEVTEEKTIDLNKKEKPCYNVEENGGKTYGDHEFEVLMTKILEKFNCTTLFIPAQIRKDSEICLNETTANMVHEYMKYSSSAYSTGMWKSNFYTLPPCVYNTFSIEKSVDGNGNFFAYHMYIHIY
jgi:hypothetical protein